MFGRIRQARALEEYQDTLHWSPYAALEVSEGPRHNIAPGTQPIALHRIGEKGDDQASRLHWGYRPPRYKRRSQYLARLDSVLRGSRVWHPLLTRRVIVPADGWFEWAGPTGAAHPWYVSACDEQPVFLAGITAWEPGNQPCSEFGFALITDASGGMVDQSRGRRPVCLGHDAALVWLDYTLTVEEATEVLAEARATAEFHWWPVTPKVKNRRYQNPDVVEPIQTPCPPQSGSPEHVAPIAEADRATTP